MEITTHNHHLAESIRHRDFLNKKRLFKDRRPDGNYFSGTDDQLLLFAILEGIVGVGEQLQALRLNLVDATDPLREERERAVEEQKRAAREEKEEFWRAYDAEFSRRRSVMRESLLLDMIESAKLSDKTKRNLLQGLCTQSGEPTETLITLSPADFVAAIHRTPSPLDDLYGIGPVSILQLRIAFPLPTPPEPSTSQTKPAPTLADAPAVQEIEDAK